MKVFRHHVYEYIKGLRDLILHTCPKSCMQEIVQLLDRRGISYVIQPVSTEKINVFFGDTMCVEVIRSWGEVPLSDLSDEEDFILGIMLGYCRKKQCTRYIKRKQAERSRLHPEDSPRQLLIAS